MKDPILNTRYFVLRLFIHILKIFILFQHQKNPLWTGSLVCHFFLNPSTSVSISQKIDFQKTPFTFWWRHHCYSCSAWCRWIGSVAKTNLKRDTTRGAFRDASTQETTSHLAISINIVSSMCYGQREMREARVSAWDNTHQRCLTPKISPMLSESLGG